MIIVNQFLILNLQIKKINKIKKIKKTVLIHRILLVKFLLW